MEKQFKLTDRVSKDSLKSPTFKKWLKRVLCFVCILSLVLQLTLCCIPMQASAVEIDSVVGEWIFKDNLDYNFIQSMLGSTFNINFTVTSSSGNVYNYSKLKFGSYKGSSYTRYMMIFVDSSGSEGAFCEYRSNDYSLDWWPNWGTIRSIIITGGNDVSNTNLITWLKSSADKVVSEVYDFTGEYRLFNEQLTNLSFAQSGTVTQTYQFDYRIWNGYSADYFTVQASGSQVDISYSFTDEGSGGVTTVYRQLLRDGNIVGTWLVPRARLIYFESNPDDTTLQQWLLDNTTLVDESMLQTVYDFGYNNGFNDGWTDNVIGDTLNAPIQALNNITLLQVGNTVITLGGVIFTMIVLCILIVFLKKFAGG